MDSEELRRDDDRRMSALEKRVDKIGDEVSEIKDNHLMHIGDDISEIKIGMKEMATNMNWMMDQSKDNKRLSYGILTGVAVALILWILKAFN
jgi:hypothetical protein